MDAIMNSIMSAVPRPRAGGSFAGRLADGFGGLPSQYVS